MQPNSTQQLKVFIQLIEQKFSVFLDFVFGEKVVPTKASKDEFDPLLFFSKRRIMKKIYKGMNKR